MGVGSSEVHQDQGVEGVPEVRVHVESQDHAAET
jgi:hypothetical protein